ncbi:hypothetical protein I4U23_027763 [Adineta vaga]|nr:hypothetical protein I4U23_027763 [Adineta vaga]
MTSHTSRRYPLKRVRPDNENQGSISISTEQTKKKFCRQSSEDSAFVESEKSSDERAFDLFHNEYFLQFRPFFKHRSIVIQFIEHLWSNMTETAKVSFVKKILKEQGIYDISSRNFHENESFLNDENDSQTNKSLNGSLPIWNTNNRYSRSFINDLLSYMKYSITPRFIDKKLPSKNPIPLRRSSRIRRAPSKCSCSTCKTTQGSEEHPSSISTMSNDSDYQIFRHLIDHYQQLDDQFTNLSTDNIKLNETNEKSISFTDVNELPNTSSLMDNTIPADNTNDIPLSSIDFSIDSSINFNEKDSVIENVDERPTRRTYVILTELDEPFFGPYPIEFTITI